jgi:G:T-mismatch repair DNA endonuclease (very short patch repair protein)
MTLGVSSRALAEQRDRRTLSPLNQIGWNLAAVGCNLVHHLPVKPDVHDAESSVSPV